MAMNLFMELVVIKKIQYLGNSVKFIIDEKESGFLFGGHHISELDVPISKVSGQLVQRLRAAPKNELHNVEMVLEGRTAGTVAIPNK